MPSIRRAVAAWKSLTPLTRGLLLFALVNGVVVDLLLMALFLTPASLTIFGQLHDFLLGIQGEDSWGPMSRAFGYVMGDHERTVYEEIFFDRGFKFQYPPTTLLIPWVILPVAERLSLSPSGILNTVSWISVLLSCLLTHRLFARSVPPAGDRGSSRRLDATLRVVAVSVLCVTFYPLIKAYTLGQIQSWINGLFAVALWLWATGRKRAAGFVVGAMCLMKPQYVVFAVWAVLRRQRGFMVTLAVTVLAGLSFSVALFSLADHWAYLDVLSFISKRGESYYSNHSVNGMLHHVLFNGYNLGWKGRLFPPFHPWIYALTIASSIAFVAIGLLWPAAKKEKAGVVDFCVIALTATIASPVAWEHHYGILPPIFACLLPRLMQRPVLGRRTLLYLGISYFLCSNFFAATIGLASIPVANAGQSYLLVGALMLGGLLLAYRRGGPQRPT